MRTLTSGMITLLALGVSSIAYADQGAPVDYDCALFNECGTTAAGGGDTPDRGKTKGFSMAAGLSAAVPTRVAVRQPVAQPMRARASVNYGGTARLAAPARASGVDLQLNFITASADLTPGARASADRLASAMMKPERLSTRFMIEGHTDAVGSRESNLDLSRRRAAAVVNYLALKGIDAKRFEVMGYGFDRPLPGTSANAAANRRVVAKPIK